MAKQKPFLNVEVLSPEGSLYKGKANSITAVNNQGKFDILPHHTNFISIIKGELVISPEEGERERKFEVQRGVLRCAEDLVKIYLGV